MLEYTDASGQIYTEDQINKMAADQKTSASAIISSKGLKKKSSKTATSTKKYPWSDQSRKEDTIGFLDTFKKTRKETKIPAPTKKISSKESQDFLNQLSSSVVQTAIDETTPFSIETESYIAAKKAKEAEKRKIDEAEAKSLSEKAAGFALRDQLKVDREIEDFGLYDEFGTEIRPPSYRKLDVDKDITAEKWINDGMIKTKPTKQEVAKIDLDVDNMLKSAGTSVMVDPGVMDEFGNQITKATYKPYQPFETELKEIKKDLASRGILNKVNEKALLDMSAQTYKAKQLAKIQESKYRDYLENTTDISEKSKNLALKYFDAQKASAAANYDKNKMILDQQESQLGSLVEKINNISATLKPKDYKFTTQQEIDEENKKITQLQELNGIHQSHSISYQELAKKTDKESEKYDNVSFLQDLYKRDYSWGGVAGKVKTRATQWAYEMVQGANFIAGNTLKGAAYDYLDIKELTGIDNPFASVDNFLADRINALGEDLQGLYPKQREMTSVEGILEKGGDLLINQAPDLILMGLTRGGSAVAKKGAEKLATEGAKQITKKSLISRTGSYLTLNAQTLPIAIRGAGAKYSEMITEQQKGYYDKEGNFIIPNYSLPELIVAPIGYGYAEGVFEKSTGRILEKGAGFFKAAAKTEKGLWYEAARKTAGQLRKDAGLNFISAQAEEQISEQLTNVVQNGFDKFLLGKDVNILDNAAEVGQDTVLMSTMLAGAPIFGGLAVRPFMSKTKAETTITNGHAMAAIIHELELNESLSDVKRTSLVGKLEVLRKKTSEIFRTTIDNMGTMSPAAFDKINSAATNIANIKNKARDIAGSDSETKEQDVAELRDEYINEYRKLNYLTSAIEGVNTFDKPISNISKANLIDLAAERVDASFNDDLSVDEKQSIFDKIEAQTESIYKSEGINLKEERVKEFEKNLEVAKKLAENTNTEVILARDSKSVDKIIDNLNKGAKFEGTVSDAQKADAKDSDGTIIDGKDGKSYIIINRGVALKQKAVSVGSHEFLHRLLSKTLANSDSQIALGQSLTDYLLTNNPELYLNESVVDRLNNNYGNQSKGTQMEELLNVFSDAILTGNIKYKETFFTKIGDQIRRYLQDLGLVNIEFNSGRDVFNFLRDYNNTISKGKDLSTAQKKLLAEGAKGSLISEGIENKPTIKQSKSAKVLAVEKKIQDLEDQYDNEELDYDDYENRSKILKSELSKAIAAEKAKPKEEAKPEVKKKEVIKDDETEIKEIIAESKGTISSDKVQQIYNEKGIEGALDIIKLFAPITKKIVDKRRDAPGFDRELLTDEIETGDGGILSLIQKYDPTNGTPLAAYINKYLPVRAITASRRILDKDFKKDAAEEKGLMATETADSGFIESAKEKPTYKNALESKLLTPEELKTAENKILTFVRTLKNRIDAPVSINRTITPIIAEIRDAMGKQLDIDLKTIMGGKKDGALRKWLLDHKRYVLENMTTTWLMGADGKGGIPQAIQKKIDGRWVNYPDWVGKKIDREAMSTDNAGRTSGAELSRRLPNVFNNVSDADYLGQILEVDGNPIRGRKESLAKAVAEELAFDIINEDLATEGPIFDAIATNQERLGYELLNNFAVTFKVASERGNVKASKSVIETMAKLTNLPEDIKAKIIGIDGNTFINYTKALTSGEDPELLFHDYYPIDEFSIEDKMTIIDSVKSLYNYYSKASLKEKTIPYGPKKGENFEAYANRKIFNALSKDESYAVILDIPVSSLGWKLPKHRKAAQDSMKSFHKEFISYVMKTDGLSNANANKLFTRLFSRGFSYGTGQSLFDTQEGFYNAFLEKVEDFSLAKSGKGKTITYNGEKVNMDISSAIQDTSAEDISNFIKTGNSKSIDYESRKKVSVAARKDVKKMMDILSEMYKDGIITNTQLGLIFKSLGGSMASPLKVSAELRYVADNKNYNKNPKEWVYEHTPPTSYISRLALGVIIGKSDLSIDDFMKDVIDNSYVAIIPKEVDKVINSLYKSTMPFSYKPGQNSLIRYFDVGFNGENIPALKDLSNGKTISNEILKNEFFPEIANKTQEAIIKNSISKAPKGISVFDFDDTVGITKGNVLYTMPDGATGKLNAEEFAKEGSRLLAEGAEFDFSEFSKVVDGKPGPMVEKMKKMIGKFGPENFFILTARPQAAAGPIHNFLSSIGIDIPLENITGLGNSTGKAKADWMVSKAAEGYNDFYFSDDAIQNITAVKEALDVLDVKSKIQQAKAKFSKSMSDEFNKIIEENKGVESYKVYSDIVAKRRGAGKNKFDLFVPPSAADFELLLYKFMGKGERGEEQQKFFDEALLKPYINGVNLMDGARQSIKKSYKALTKAFPDVQKKLEKLSPDKDFTYDQAIRVALWNDAGIEIPGLTQRDNKKLVEMVNGDTELLAFKEGLKAMSRQEKGWVEPSEYWDTDTIVSDLFNITQSGGRKKFLGEFIENVETIFGKWEAGKLVGPNMNKIQAVYGTNVREALEDSLYRMINGKNRSYGQDRETSMWTNWVTGSTGVIMFLNTRSAVLQLLSTANFLNLRDNNPIAAAKAFANQKQYWSDFATIWNSDKMKERRGGLREDVVASEIANAAAGSKNKAAAVISYLLKIGYTPTQLADSFAISSGGAPYYRNRIKTHISEGMSETEAETLAWEEFSKIADETQQSGDPKDISKQQASGAGRLLLTFQNTAMQQSRLVKKAFLDLKNGRGDVKTNIAKISYYLVIQNTIFSVLQQGLFSVLFDEDEEEAKRNKSKDEKAVDLANGVLDSILRGTGFYGGIAATLKNAAVKYMEQQNKKQKDYAAVVIEAANISPPIGSKLRKLYTGLKQTEYDKDLIKERGWGIMQDGRVHLGPMYSVTGKGAEVLLNVPMDRLVNKIENVSQALNNQNKAWQRAAVALGFTPWTVGIEKPAGDLKIIEEAKAKRKIEGLAKAEITRKEKSKALKDSIKSLTPSERLKYRRSVALEKREIALAKRKKRKMGGD
jgi:hypothetical protein